MSVFAGLLPQAASVEAEGAMWFSGLWPEEEGYAVHMVPRRRAEFTAGRNAARAALASLGLAPAPILVGTRRAPVFPAGVTGSITHTAGFCAAAVARCGEVLAVGIDAEGVKPLPAELAPLILRPEEQGGNLPYAGKLAFSAKEAFYKAWFPLHGTELDFLDVRVGIEPAHGSFTVALCGPRVPAFLRGRGARGSYLVDADRVYTALAIRDYHLEGIE
ncbi:MAG: 4'-phosphopantetheinyl transferase family protein [Telluria sp.]